jgi:hypothetical protein
MLRNHFYPVDERLPGSDTCLRDVTTNTLYDVLWDSWSCCGAGGFAYTRTGPFAGPTMQDCTTFTKSGEDRIVINGLCSPLEVDIDIKPGSDPNSINTKKRGVIPVAILTTDVFDALTVDEDSVRFGPAEAEKVHKRAHVVDVDDDGDLDLVLHFRTQDTGIAPGDIEACLTGQTYDGVPIMGCDSVRTVPPE